MGNVSRAFLRANLPLAQSGEASLPSHGDHPLLRRTHAHPRQQSAAASTLSARSQAAAAAAAQAKPSSAGDACPWTIRFRGADA